MRRHALLLLFVLLGPSTSLAAGQGRLGVDRTRLRVFLDCAECFPDFLREEIRWVDFVRQAADADVHVLTSVSSTGGGGREIAIRLSGAGQFAGTDQQLRAVLLAQEPPDAERRAILNVVSVGLLTYLAKAGVSTSLELTVEPGAAALPTGGIDPWDFWVFSGKAAASVWAQQASRQITWSARFTGDRVTEGWKVSFGAQIDHDAQRYRLVDEPDPIEVSTRTQRLDVFAGKSLGQHWSAGATGEVESSTYYNLSASAGVSPTIEFSVLPYDDYAEHQLLLQYRIGFSHVRYEEVTIFGKTVETLWRHAFSATLNEQQPWGSIEANLDLSQYLHDAGKYRLTAGGKASIRVARGWSVDVEGSLSRQRDQLSVPLRDASDEEVLLELRELLSGYEATFDIGITYSFGSLFNNIVNPRFGRRR